MRPAPPVEQMSAQDEGFVIPLELRNLPPEWPFDEQASEQNEEELNAQIAQLSGSDRAKLYRFATQELRAMPHFEPHEGSAVFGQACLRVMCKLNAHGLNLSDIEED